MKILLLSDTHFKLIGSFFPFNSISKNDITYELERALKSIDFVINIINKEKPDIIIHLGDVYHSLNTNYNIVTSYTSYKFKELYSIIKSINSTLIILNGNHDYVNNTISMIDTLSSDLSIKQPTNINITTNKIISLISYLPDNVLIYKELYNAINNPDVKYIFTHYSINGFRYNRNKIIEDGINIPDNDKIIVSGHIHIRQYYKNIYYVGSLYQNTISEYSDNGNGIMIIEDNNIRFIENNYVGYIKNVSFQVLYNKLIEEEDFSILDRIDGFKIYFESLEEEVKYFGDIEQILKDYNIKYIKTINQNINNSNINISSYIDNVPSNDKILETIFTNYYPEYNELYNKYFKGV